MRVLIIKLSPIEAITSSMFRTIALANGIVENGHNVDMLVLPMNDILAKVEEISLSDKVKIIKTNDYSIYRNIVAESESDKVRGTAKSKIKSLLRKCWHSFSVYDYTYMVAKKISINLLETKKYDLVISSSDPKSSHIAVKNLIKQGLEVGQWYQYWGDPLAIDITRTNIYPRFILKGIENSLIKNAQKIVYVSPFTLEKQKQMFPEHSGKMCFLPVPYIKSEMYPETKNIVYKIGYFGNYSSSVRNILPFYEACCKLDRNYETFIFGDGNVLLESKVNVKVYPRGDVTEHKKMVDLLVCVCNVCGTQIPGKLYHLAGTNKAVLVILDGDDIGSLKSYIDSFDRFITCENNVESIKGAIINARLNKKKYFPSESLCSRLIAEKFLE